MNIYCNNCGNEGHLYRHCRLPVLSYGILIVNKHDELLMIRRKDSLSYIEFLRGKYDLTQGDYIYNLINTCSVVERDLLRSSSFDELWSNLWFSGPHKKKQTDRMIKEYHSSLCKFIELQKGKLYEYLDRCDKFYQTPEWEFPKGRRSNRESNMTCAIREFEEETDISSNDYIILQNIIPISEEYTGTNGVRYKHIYYIALYKGDTELHINQEKYEQYSEIGDIGWFSLDDCCENLREEQTSKQVLLKRVKLLIQKKQTDFRVKV